MPGELVTVATFDTFPEADLARHHLEAAGIRVSLMDETMGGMFWELSNAIGGIKLQVLQEDEPKAVEILEGHAAEERGPEGEVAAADIESATWTCTLCGIEVSAACATCPSCGVAMHAREDDYPRSSRILLEGQTEATEGEEAPAPTEELCRRAARAAILGVLMCPPLLQIYSLWLLFRLTLVDEDLNERATRYFFFALVLDLLVVGMALVSMVLFFVFSR